MGKRHKPEEIVVKLRQVDVLTSQGSTVADAIRQIGVTEITYYRWRKEFGGLQTNQVRLPPVSTALSGYGASPILWAVFDRLQQAGMCRQCRIWTQAMRSGGGGAGRRR